MKRIRTKLDEIGETKLISIAQLNSILKTIKSDLEVAYTANYLTGDVEIITNIPNFEKILEKITPEYIGQIMDVIYNKARQYNIRVDELVEKYPEELEEVKRQVEDLLESGV